MNRPIPKYVDDAIVAELRRTYLQRDDHALEQLLSHLHCRERQILASFQHENDRLRGVLALVDAILTTGLTDDQAWSVAMDGEADFCHSVQTLFFLAKIATYY